MGTFIRFSILSALIIAGTSLAQNNTLDNVHLFQTFLRDAPIALSPYGQGGLTLDNYDQASLFDLGVEGGIPITPRIEINGAWAFRNWNPDFGDSESGLTDLIIGGRYNITPGPTKISAGGYLTLPIGAEKIGEGNVDFGAYGALRHPLPSGIVLTGVLGLDFIETVDYNFRGEKDTNYETSLLLGGGAIFPINDQTHIVSELDIMTEQNWAMLSGGVDYQLKTGGRLRGGLGLGLDDGAPDIRLEVKYLYIF